MIPGLRKKRRQLLRTRDLSNSGAFLECGGQPYPPVGTELEVRSSGPVGGEKPRWSGHGWCALPATVWRRRLFLLELKSDITPFLQGGWECV